MRLSCFGFLVCCLAFASTIDARPAGEANPAERINKLIEQLGSTQFDEREQAAKALDAIGRPALNALQKATKSSDVEIQRRAKELVQKITQRVANDKILAPTRIRLQYDSTPVEAAVGDLAKKSGYAIILAGDKSKLAERRVTVDTGEVPFWEAFDRFCEKAGLVEAGAHVGQKQAPAHPVAPATPVPPKPAAPAVPPVPVPARVGPAANPVQPLPAAVGGGTAANTGRITLVDGVSRDLPTCYQGAVRIRALPPGTLIPGISMRMQEIVLGLEISPEPKLQMQSIVSIAVEKAVDREDQALVQAQSAATDRLGRKDAALTPSAVLPYPGNLKQVPIVFKTPNKPAANLKELKGLITAKARTEPEEILKINNVLQAGKLEVKGPGSSVMRLLEACRDADGVVTIRVQVEYSNQSIVANAANQQLKTVAVVRPGAVPAAGPAASTKYRSFGGITLTDSKVELFDLHVKQSSARMADNIYAREFTFTCQSTKDRGEPVKLAFVGQRVVTVEIPFTLTNVPLP